MLFRKTLQLIQRAFYEYWMCLCLRVCAAAWECLFKTEIVTTVTLSATVHTLLAIRSVCARVCVCAHNICRSQRGNGFPQRVFHTALQSVSQISGSSGVAVPHPL